jgi:hypothetical protein
LTEALPVPPATAMTIAGMAKKLRHHPARCGPLGERLDLYQIENTIRRRRNQHPAARPP